MSIIYKNLIIPALSCRIESHTLQLKSSYPAKSNRPDLEKATLVIPKNKKIMKKWEYFPLDYA